MINQWFLFFQNYFNKEKFNEFWLKFEKVILKSCFSSSYHVIGWTRRYVQLKSIITALKRPEHLVIISVTTLFIAETFFKKGPYKTVV